MRISSPATTGLVNGGGKTRAPARKLVRSSFSECEKPIPTWLPAETRIRTSTSCTGSGSSTPVVRSTCTMGMSSVVRPTSFPSRMARPVTPLKASQPRVAGLFGVSRGAAAGAGPSKRHSVRGGGGDGATRLATDSGL